ncbi:MAG: TlpA family protein disulfide reductase [Stenotrophobium sp.]
MLKPIGIAALLLFFATRSAYALDPGDIAPDFTADSLTDHAPMRFSDFHGKVIYLDFWTSWCAPCRESFPLMEKLSAELGAGGFQVLAVNLDAQPADALKFLRGQDVHFPVVDGVSESVPEQYGIKAMPAAYIIDRGGTVRAVRSDLRQSELKEVRALIVELLQEAKK